MAEFTEITDVESLLDNIEVYTGELLGWLRTANTSDWGGTTSSLSAAGVAMQTIDYNSWYEVDIYTITEDVSVQKLWRELISEFEDDSWMDKADYYGATVGSTFDSQTGIFHGDSWAEMNIGGYELDGMSNDEANDRVMDDLSEMAEPAYHYAQKMHVIAKQLEDNLFDLVN